MLLKLTYVVVSFLIFFTLRALLIVVSWYLSSRRPNEALLSINCFQKDLGDTNPLVRAWALRTMAGIRLHVIAPLVLAAINKCARDPSVYVRKCAANALPKLNDLRLEENASAIEEVYYLSANMTCGNSCKAISVCNTFVTCLWRNVRVQFEGNCFECFLSVGFLILEMSFSFYAPTSLFTVSLSCRGFTIDLPSKMLRVRFILLSILAIRSSSIGFYLCLCMNV